MATGVSLRRLSSRMRISNDWRQPAAATHSVCRRSASPFLRGVFPAAEPGLVTCFSINAVRPPTSASAESNHSTPSLSKPFFIDTASVRPCNSLCHSPFAARNGNRARRNYRTMESRAPGLLRKPRLSGRTAAISVSEPSAFSFSGIFVCFGSTPGAVLRPCDGRTAQLQAYRYLRISAIGRWCPRGESNSHVLADNRF